MAKSDYFPRPDGELLMWHDRFILNLASLKTQLGLSDEDIAGCGSDNKELHGKVAAANIAAAASHHATAEKQAYRNQLEDKVRALARRIKSHPSYTDALGNLLGIVGAEISTDLSDAKPILKAVDQTGGIVVLSFQKSKSDGINIYSQRDNDSEFLFLARDTLTRYVDNRPLLIAGKPELRRYTAVYVVKDVEVGQFSDELVVSCAP
ncbi:MULTISPECIES: hypothetical protein [Methylomonas]|uniref:Uncharacterized protein n=2 Tax=Methylomonas TaxID=416 RepID=A0A177PBG4_9GAMM|nr:MULTISPECIES: hypothetical protein [Methylomonas]OAI26779.1 hypothetical protein A1355_18575 [Methylomonas koyamae]OHX35998.1 hypothetical protein BJL95_22360 [Methylomonas sp. LWB]